MFTPSIVENYIPNECIPKDTRVEGGLSHVYGIVAPQAMLFRKGPQVTTVLSVEFYQKSPPK